MLPQHITVLPKGVYDGDTPAQFLTRTNGIGKQSITARKQSITCSWGRKS